MSVVWRWPYKTQNKIFENPITYVIFNIGFKIVPFPICRWDEMKEFLKKLCFIGREIICQEEVFAGINLER